MAEIIAIAPHQPWASLVACGAIGIVVMRDPPPRFGDACIIGNAVQFLRAQDALRAACEAFESDHYFGSRDAMKSIGVDLARPSALTMPRNKVLGTCRVDSAVPVMQSIPLRTRAIERALAQFEPGQGWAWLISNAKLLPSPIPVPNTQVTVPWLYYPDHLFRCPIGSGADDLPEPLTPAAADKFRETI